MKIYFISSKVKVLYCRNLSSQITEDDLKVNFEKFGGIERVKKIKAGVYILQGEIISFLSSHSQILRTTAINFVKERRPRCLDIILFY